MVARRAGNLFQPKRHIGLGAKVKFHVGMDREGVETLLADATPITVGSHEPFVDGEVGLFADGALDRVQAPFHFLLAERDHIFSIAGGVKKAQPPSRSEWDRLTSIRGALY